jgi:dihydroflavonol-4-reductase
MILVTGGTGFVGAYIICRLLKQGKKERATRRTNSRMEEFEMICTVNGISSIELENLSWHHADILNTVELEDAFKGVDEVIHAAAIVSFLPGDKYKLLQNNITGTANMVNLSIDLGIKKFGYLSSVAALGRKAEDKKTAPGSIPTAIGENISYIDENTKWEESEHNTNYAVSKYQSELEVWRGAAEGLNVVILNPGIIIGACDFSRNTGKMFDMAYHGLKFYTPGITGFVDVRDVAQVITVLMDRDIFNERFVMVGGNLEFRKLYELAAGALNKPKPVYDTPRWMAGLGYRAFGLMSKFTGKPPLITKETTNAAYNKFFYDNSKIRKTLNFEFTPLEETIRWTCEWYLKLKK